MNGRLTAVGCPSPVVIVGAGFSGTLAAAQLARRAVPCILIEPRDTAARGTAYATKELVHLLNVRAESMSAWPDRPGDFGSYWAQRGGIPHDFAPRNIYGGYLEQLLAEATSTGLVTLVQAAATAARRDEHGWTVELSDGARIACGHLVLAMGNEAPILPNWASPIGKYVVDDPWGTQARKAIASAAKASHDVLVIGSGLTMVDVVLSLDAAGFTGSTVAVSRRGLVPRAHCEHGTAPAGQDQVPPAGLLGLWRYIRDRASRGDWRAAVDSIRPHAQLLWQQLSLVEKKRFLRHARPWWDVHRHRIAPVVAQRLDALVRARQLQVLAGKVAGAAEAEGRAAVDIRLRHGNDQVTRHFDVVFNCTGPLGGMSETRSPLLRQLIRDRLVTLDPLGIGIAVEENSRAVGHHDLWAAGPLTKGQFWEITAVPDIRVQVAKIAAAIAGGSPDLYPGRILPVPRMESREREIG